MLTTEDMGRLRVPLAVLDGFDPVGLAVLVDQTDLWSGTVCDEDLVHDRWTVYRAGGGLWDVWTRQMSVDLADAATRDRVARHLAARVGLEVGSTAPGWWRWTPDGGGWALADGTPNGVDRAAVFPWRADVSAVFNTGEQRWFVGTPVCNLDPTDDRRLPDGSRYVDALALGLVAVGAHP